jgi:hypothetical protein
MEDFLNKLFDKHSEGYGVYDRKQIIKEFTDKHYSNQLRQTTVEVGQSEQLVLFAEWLQYNGKYQMPESQVKSFLEQQ